MHASHLPGFAAPPTTDWYSFTYLPLVLAAAFTCLTLFVSIPGFGTSTLPCPLELEPDLYRNMSIYMLVLLINPNNPSRMAVARAAWHRDFKALSPKSIFRVGMESLPSSSTFPDAPLVSPKRPYIPEHKLLFIFHDHLQEFLHSTNMSWFVRTTEDVLVHLKRLPLMIRDLEKRFNPRTDYVMQGQAVDISPGVTFIHGGSGWIMSRACAEFYVARLAEINKTFIVQPHGDDMMPNFFKEMINLSTEQMFHGGFVGSPLEEKARVRLKKGDYNGLPICPSLEFQKERLRMSMYLNETVFWHAGSGDLAVVSNGYRMMAEAPPWLGFGHIFGGITLCRADVPLSSATDGPPW
jgi:hypothetical protein